VEEVSKRVLLLQSIILHSSSTVLIRIKNMVDTSKLDSTVNSLRKNKDSVFKYHTGSTSGTANICYTHEKCHPFCQVTGN